MDAPIVFTIIGALFGYFAISLSNQKYKSFFFLLSLLMVVLTFASFYGKVEETCVVEGASYCLKWERKTIIPGNDALIYGFGLLLVAFIIIHFLELFIKATKVSV